MSMAAYTNKTASGAVLSAGGTCYGAVLTSGSDAATLILYDNTAGSGTIICKLAVAAANTTVVFTPVVGLPVGTGLYAALTGTSPSATVVHTP